MSPPPGGAATHYTNTGSGTGSGRAVGRRSSLGRRKFSQNKAKKSQQRKGTCAGLRDSRKASQTHFHTWALAPQLQIARSFVFQSLEKVDCSLTSMRSRCKCRETDTRVGAARMGGTEHRRPSVNATAALCRGRDRGGYWKRSFGLAASSYFLSDVLCTLT